MPSRNSLMKEREMAIAQVADGAGLSEALARILADGFEKPIPTVAVAIALRQ